MIFVEGGTFQMGSNDYSNEQPIHPVTLTDYYIAETQTTQALYEAVMGNNPAHFKGANLPVEQVSWYDAQAFITKLNEIAKPSVGVWCLPTEAQWEYAARGGKKSGGFRFAGSNDIDKVAWYNGNSETQTHPVAVKWANELGLYDMSGNVWEWCADDYDSEAYQKVKADMLNPICIEGKILEYSAFSSINEKRNNNLKRVLRGGAWRDNGCRASLRVNDTAGNRSNDVGFRLSIMLPL
jgi:formylglycine-generating enzyme required for sulfatase activity